jgi:hypothetical protein
MGYSCVMKPGFWSSFYNQASLPFNSSPGVGFNYENRFGMKELGTTTAGAIIPSGGASIGAFYSHSGCRDFVRQTAALASGLKLSDKLSAGIQIDYFSEKYPGTDNHTRAVTVEGGVLISASENIRVGIHVFNPVPNSIRKCVIPSTISAGAGINLNSLLFASAGIRMTLGKRPVLVLGSEYVAVKNFWLRGGFCSENTSFSFGFGYKYRKLKFDLGFATHEILGITSSVSIIVLIR